MNGLHNDMGGAGIVPGQIPRLIEQIQAGEESANSDLVELLARDFEARTAAKHYFPISILRETCRQYLKHSSLACIMHEAVRSSRVAMKSGW
jgi:hypothetical protein